MKRVADEPAFVLHRYDWSESSLILELLTRHFGRIAVVAKGAKKPSSNFRPVLLPLQPLHVAFGGDAEIRTLKQAEWLGGQVMPTGDKLLSGYYLNELLLRLLARDDPHPALFDAYAATVRVLGSDDAEHTLQPGLRAFELLLLREIGLLPVLDMQTATLARLDPRERYSLKAEGGLVEAAETDARASLSGAQWLALQAALDDPAPFAATVREAAAAPELKPQLRALLHYHCGVHTLRTRQLMIDLQAL
ncbi:MAG: recO [Ramlibacter sp.]|nr:recO [Ramlibacter sp.]